MDKSRKPSYRLFREIALKSTNRKFQITAIVCLVLLYLAVFLIISGGVSGLWVYQILGESPQLAEVNLQDPFIEDRENEFHLSRVIPKYDDVITAIEQYYQDNGSYPEELTVLVPNYLSKEPGIYLRNGDYITYELEPWITRQGNTPPFTFSISGHYPFLAFMHGWELIYCPASYSGCAAGGDRHINAHRVNEQWIWVHSSAL